MTGDGERGAAGEGRDPQRTLLWIGWVLGVLVAGGLAWVLAQDRELRLQAAEQRSIAIADGVAKLLYYQLRNLDRAMRGIAGDAAQAAQLAPERADALLAQSVAGVSGRHAELQRIDIVTRGSLASDGAPLPAWTASAGSASAVEIRMGPPARDIDGRWLLPLAMPLADGRWAVAQLRVADLQPAVVGFDTGRAGIVSVYDRSGILLARNDDPARYVGQSHPTVAASEAGEVAVLERDTRGVDGRRRVTATRGLADYPLLITAGIAREEVLGPWWVFLGIVCVGMLGYIVAFALLVSTARRAVRVQRALSADVRAAVAAMRMAQHVGRTGTWTTNAAGTHLAWSEQVCELLGLPDDRTSLPLEDFYAIVHDDDRDALRATFDAAWTAGDVFASDYRIVRSDGDIRWLAVRAAMVASDDGAVMSGTAVDITERAAAEATLIAAEERFRLMFERNPMPFWVFDVETLRFLEVNDAAVAHYGYSRDEFLAMTIADIRPPDARAMLLADVREPREGHGPPRVWLHRKRDGTLLEVRVHSADCRIGGRPARLVLAQDVTERMTFERERAFQATHDPATGLLNLQALLLAAAPGGSGDGYGIVHVRLPGLDLLGNTLGRAIGDEVLREAARHLEALGARFGAVAHVPTEAFVLLVSDRSRIAEAADAVRTLLAQPIEHLALAHRPDAQLGTATSPADGATAEQVAANASLAAHEAAERGAGLLAYDAAMGERIAHRLKLAARVREAIDQDAFTLHFQVIRRAADLAPVALEALVRWPQPDGGFIPPCDFIPLCETSGLILPLGAWVLRRAARDHRLLADAGWGDLPIAINVSAVQFLHHDLPAEMAKLAEEFSLPRGALQVELTESAVLARPEQAMETMRALQAQGVRISLDDFGTGFSSMAHLKDLPLDTLKIDRAFIEQVDVSPRSAAICDALIVLGHSVGLNIIAEGIEHAGQQDWLVAHGCDELQGYHLGRPAPLGDVVALLDAGRAG